jgi:hypothetical protein
MLPMPGAHKPQPLFHIVMHLLQLTIARSGTKIIFRRFVVSGRSICVS